MAWTGYFGRHEKPAEGRNRANPGLPDGFVSDHLEILYDLDIEAKQLASELGIHLERVRSLNQDPKYIKVLRDIVLQLEAKDAGQYDM